MKDLSGWAEENRLSIGLAAAGLALVGGGLFWWKTGGWQPQPQVEIIGAETIVASPSAAVKDILVDVSGAVAKSGVYKLLSGQRVDDAIRAAGGLTPEADTVWIEKNLNRSAKLADGIKIYIPKINEQITNSNYSSLREQTINNLQITNKSININTASATELDTLPGIGPVTAAKIISGRPYEKTEELTEKKIVTAKVWENIKDRIDVW